MSNISTMNMNNIKKRLAELDAQALVLTTPQENKTVVPIFAVRESKCASLGGDGVTEPEKSEDALAKKTVVAVSESKCASLGGDSVAEPEKTKTSSIDEREAVLAKKEAAFAKKEELAARIAAVTKLEEENKRKSSIENSDFEKKMQRERENAAYKIKCDQQREKEREEAAARRYAPMFVVGVHRPVVGLDYRSLKSSSYPIMGSHYGYGIGSPIGLAPMLPPMFIARH